MIFIVILLLLLSLFLLPSPLRPVFNAIVFVSYIFFLDDDGFVFNADGSSRCIALPFQGLCSKDVIGVNNLLQNLPLAKVATNAHGSRRAERAFHRTTYLGRNTECGAAALRTVMAHNDRFYDVAILQLHAQLGGSAIATETTLNDLGCEGNEAIIWIGEEG